jgi:hypothetical protein
MFTVNNNTQTIDLFHSTYFPDLFFLLFTSFDNQYVVQNGCVMISSMFDDTNQRKPTRKKYRN